MILQYPVGKPTIQNAHKDESTIIYSGLSFFCPHLSHLPHPGRVREVREVRAVFPLAYYTRAYA